MMILKNDESYEVLRYACRIINNIDKHIYGNILYMVNPRFLSNICMHVQNISTHIYIMWLELKIEKKLI